MVFVEERLCFCVFVPKRKLNALLFVMVASSSQNTCVVRNPLAGKDPGLGRSRFLSDTTPRRATAYFPPSAREIKKRQQAKTLQLENN